VFAIEDTAMPLTQYSMRHMGKLMTFAKSMGLKNCLLEVNGVGLYSVELSENGSAKARFSPSKKIFE
jgi:hypothetical protein